MKKESRITLSTENNIIKMSRRKKSLRKMIT